MDFWIQLQTIGAAWASAIATAAATGTALWLALSDRRQRRIEREEAVKLIAAGVAVYLEELRLELVTALRSLEKGFSTGSVKDLTEFLLVVAGNVRTLNTTVLSSHELNVLSALPDNAGEKIYAALACIRSVQDGLGRRLETATQAVEGDILAKFWYSQLQWAHGLIEEGQSVCAKHGTLRIIKPKP
ncbi:MAG TPA: hypothetical protein DDZ58_08535 [Achromobacter sp.]|uniref:hypothetical protein n=1 Tax=Achromobacter kerstersii TaxID=1353890 RepID=UPI000E9A07E6|nr:hypothetical protein [Achromobacter sp.]